MSEIQSRKCILVIIQNCSLNTSSQAYFCIKQHLETNNAPRHQSYSTETNLNRDTLHLMGCSHRLWSSAKEQNLFYCQILENFPSTKSQQNKFYLQVVHQAIGFFFNHFADVWRLLKGAFLIVSQSLYNLTLRKQ